MDKELNLLLRAYGASSVKKEVERVNKSIQRLPQSFSKISDVVARTERTTNKYFNELKQLSSPKIINAQQMFGESIKKVTNELGKATNITAPIRKKGFLPEGFDKNFTNVNAELKKFGNSPAWSITKQVSQKTIPELNSRIKGLRKQFDGAALSVMFLGMAMTRVFTQIWTQGTKTFQDVMHSVEGTVTQFDMLNATGDMLKFTMGAALEPLVAQIIPTIEWITKLISENEELFRIIVTGLAVGGAVLTAYGMLKLGISGLIDVYGTVKTAAQNFITYLSNIDWKSINEGVNNLGKSLGTVRSNMDWIKKNPIKTLFVVGVITGIIAAVSWIINLKNAMGGLGEFFKNLGLGIGKVWGIVFGSLAELVGSFIDYGVSKINFMIDLINKVASWSNSVLGTNFGQMELVSWESDIAGFDFEDVYSGMVKASESLFGTPDKGYTDSFGSFNDPYKGTTVINNYYNATSDEIQSSPNPWALQLNSSL